MIYFCADDYGISAGSNSRIKKCIEKGALNKVSVLPNGEIDDLKHHLSGLDAELSLHINLVEGSALSDPEEVSLIVSDKGYFKYSFIGLLFLSVSGKRKELEKQLYKEIQKQIQFWKEAMSEKSSFSIDSHQHTHMIPLVFKTLMRVINDEKVDVKYIRIPAEPALPYLFTPSLYCTYSLKGFIKQWLLKLFAFLDSKELKKSEIPSAYFMGVMFSGVLNGEKIKKLLPRYIKLAEKNNKNIEIGFHPGYLKNGEKLFDGTRQDFAKFYFSPWRETEFDTLLNFKFE